MLAGAAATSLFGLHLLLTGAGTAQGVPNADDSPIFDIEQSRTVVPSSVSLTGGCPPLGGDSIDGFQYPDVALLSMPTAGVEERNVPLGAGGRLQETLLLGRDVEAGDHVATLSCPLTFDAPFEFVEAQDTVTVLDAPTLSVTPEDAIRGQTVVATGTCESTVEETSLALDGVEVAVVRVQEQGLLGEVLVPIPDDADGGSHEMTTSCGGRATIVVRVATPPAGPPPGDLVPVPNVVGLPREQAEAVLANAGLEFALQQGTGSVTGQEPTAGQLVAAGTVVTLEFTVSPPSPRPKWLLPVGGGALAVGLVGGSLLGRQVHRVRTERRWLDTEAEVRSTGSGPRFDAPPPGRAPGLDIRLEVRRDIRERVPS